jgi:hypothetical protein
MAAELLPEKLCELVKPLSLPRKQSPRAVGRVLQTGHVWRELYSCYEAEFPGRCCHKN